MKNRKPSKEGNFHTGLWVRHYNLSNGLELVLTGGGVTPLPPNPERLWAGTLHHNKRRIDCERTLETENHLEGLVEWVDAFNTRFFEFREKDLEEVISRIELSELIP
jgi:hypothetical protein